VGLWPTPKALFFASATGLHVLRTPDGTVETVPGSDGWTPIRCVRAEGDALLVGTDRGLIVCDATGALRARYDASSGLACDAVSAVEVADRFVWLGTLGAGLSRIEKRLLIGGE